MPAIKITLSRLIELFAKSVNSDLPEPVRALAARLMTLTAHVTRIEKKSDAQFKALSEQISLLTEIAQAFAHPQGAPAASAVAAPAAPATPPVVTNAEQAEEEQTPDDEFEARLRAEVAAEIAAVNTEPTAEIVEMPRSKKAGGAK